MSVDDNKVQGHDKCMTENLKGNMNTYWHETDGEQRKCAINDGSSYADYAVSMIEE
jgi:hypothetical protein